jgi:hypothetical protein
MKRTSLSTLIVAIACVFTGQPMATASGAFDRASGVLPHPTGARE